jgi:hypothetical protein
MKRQKTSEATTSWFESMSGSHRASASDPEAPQGCRKFSTRRVHHAVDRSAPIIERNNNQLR